jgi:hypothetical protein
MAAFLCLGKLQSSNIMYTELVPFFIKLLGKLIMRKAVIDNTSVPISSSRNPSHSVAAQLWKDIRKPELIPNRLFWKNSFSFLKHLMVVAPRTVSEK